MPPLNSVCTLAPVCGWRRGIELVSSGFAEVHRLTIGDLFVGPFPTPLDEKSEGGVDPRPRLDLLASEYSDITLEVFLVDRELEFRFRRHLSLPLTVSAHSCVCVP
jgi:hypothetical protein